MFVSSQLEQIFHEFLRRIDLNSYDLMFRQNLLFVNETIQQAFLFELKICPSEVINLNLNQAQLNSINSVYSSIVEIRNSFQKLKNLKTLWFRGDFDNVKKNIKSIDSQLDIFKEFYNSLFSKIEYDFNYFEKLKSAETLKKEKIDKNNKDLIIFLIALFFLVGICPLIFWFAYEQDKKVIRILTEINLYGGVPGVCSHCEEKPSSPYEERPILQDHLETRCNRMSGHDYIRRHNEIVQCIQLFLCQKYGIEKRKSLITHSVQEISANSDIEIRVNISVEPKAKQSANEPDIVIHDKKKGEIILIEVGITSQEQLRVLRNIIMRKYEVFSKKLGLAYNCRTTVIPYVISWDGNINKFPVYWAKRIGLTANVESSIQSIVLRKNLEDVSNVYRRNNEENIQNWLSYFSTLGIRT